ncbi:hypothetical protein HDV00_007174 [Rhizophlyctis rosea]|nr:hypothetical protein HDV00_007174 [Rhizophlyctis rosea]
MAPTKLVAIVSHGGSAKRISFDRLQLTWNEFAETIKRRHRLAPEVTIRVTYKYESTTINVDGEDDFEELLDEDGAMWPVSFDVSIVRDQSEPDGSRGTISMFAAPPSEVVTPITTASLTPRTPTTSTPRSPPAASGFSLDPTDVAFEELRAASGFDLMLSYQWDHQPMVLRLRQALQQRGFSVWMDLNQMHGNVYEKMYEAVTKCRVVCTCLTKKYELSANCKRELCFAADLRKSIIPARLDRGPFTWTALVVAGQLYIELVDLEGPAWEAKMDELAKEIRFALGTGGEVTGGDDEGGGGGGRGDGEGDVMGGDVGEGAGQMEGQEPSASVPESDEWKETGAEATSTRPPWPGGEWSTTDQTPILPIPPSISQSVQNTFPLGASIETTSELRMRKSQSEVSEEGVQIDDDLLGEEDEEEVVPGGVEDDVIVPVPVEVPGGMVGIEDEDDEDAGLVHLVPGASGIHHPVTPPSPAESMGPWDGSGGSSGLDGEEGGVGGMVTHLPHSTTTQHPRPHHNQRPGGGSGRKDKEKKRMKQSGPAQVDENEEAKVSPVELETLQPPSVPLDPAGGAFKVEEEETQITDVHKSKTSRPLFNLPKMRFPFFSRTKTPEAAASGTMAYPPPPPFSYQLPPSVPHQPTPRPYFGNVDSPAYEDYHDVPPPPPPMHAIRRPGNPITGPIQPPSPHPTMPAITRPGKPISRPQTPPPIQPPSPPPLSLGVTRPGKPISRPQTPPPIQPPSPPPPLLGVTRPGKPISRPETPPPIQPPSPSSENVAEQDEPVPIRVARPGKPISRPQTPPPIQPPSPSSANVAEQDEPVPIRVARPGKPISRPQTPPPISSEGSQQDDPVPLRVDSLPATTATHSTDRHRRSQTLPVTANQPTRTSTVSTEPRRRPGAKASLPVHHEPPDHIKAWLTPLPPSHDYYHLLARHHPGTRTWLLTSIQEWVMTPTGTSDHILWLRGAAGMGKSVMAAFVSHHLETLGVKRIHFFCKHDDKERSDALGVVRNLLWRVVSAVPSVRGYVEERMREDEGVAGRGVSEGLGVLVGAVRSLGEEDGKPIVIIVDALDECKRHRGFLSALMREVKSPDYPKRLKWFLTGRPEMDIVEALGGGEREEVQCRELVPNEEHNREDILLFSKARLGLRITDSELLDEVAGVVAEKSEGVFMYAYLVCESIDSLEVDGGDVPGVIDTLPLGTDHIYYRALNVAYPPTEPTEDFHRVMGAVVVLEEPLTINALASLLKMTEASVWGVVNRMRSVLDFTQERKLRVLHKSLADYLTGRASDWRFRLKRGTHHERVAGYCMASMVDLLERNMCLLDGVAGVEEVGGLEELIRRYVPEHLRYAVRFWTGHLRALMDSLEEAVGGGGGVEEEGGGDRSIDSLTQLLITVLEDKLLNWVEGLSLLSSLALVIPATHHLEQFLILHRNPTLRASAPLASDLRNLVTRFYPSIQSHPQSIYTLALPFCPIDTHLQRLYSPQNGNAPKVLAGQEKSWSSLLMTIDTRSDRIRAVIVWPDGSKLGTASNDGTIRVWDAQTGMGVLVIKANDDWVRCLALAEGGRSLLANGDRNEIKVYDSESGELKQTISGHSAVVTHVAVRTDGKSGVSSSKDSRVGVWTFDGKKIERYFTGHTAAINKVILSADDRFVFTAVQDRTSRMWDFETGALLHCFEGGHEDSITDVVISGDGKVLITGAWDTTVCLWDTNTGAMLHKLSEVSHRITSLCLLPNDYLITAGSDGTAWVRDLTALLASPSQVDEDFKVATKGVMGILNNWSETGYSIALFPFPHDRIAIGCRDEKIRVYSTDVERLPRPKKLTDVHTVAVSRNGSCILTGDGKGRVKVWEVQDKARTLLRVFEGLSKPRSGKGKEVAEFKVGVSPEGKSIAILLEDGDLITWEVGSEKEVRMSLDRSDEETPLKMHPKSVGISADGRRVVVCFKWNVKGVFHGLVRAWDRAASAWIATMKDDGFVNTAGISDDGELVMLGDRDGGVRIWNVADDSFEELGSHTGPVVCTVMSPDGKSVASGSKDSTVRVWMRSGVGAKTRTDSAPPTPLVLTDHDKSVFHIQFNTDGSKLITSSSDQSARLWDLATGGCVGLFRYPLMEWRKFACSENALCVANRSGNTVVVVDVFNQV